MSKAKTPIKVLKTAIKRLNKGWMTGDWAKHDPNTGQTFVCLEGAIFGFCDKAQTPQQKEALEVCEQILFERLKDGLWEFYDKSYQEDVLKFGPQGLVPRFNDSVAKSSDELVEICKLAIIRLETGGPVEDDEFIEFDPDEDLVDLLPKK